MRLSTKFIFLIAGTLIVPFIAVFLVIVLSQLWNVSGQTQPFEIMRLKRTLKELERRGSDPEKILDLLRKDSPHAQAMVLDQEGHVAFSTYHAGSPTDLLIMDDAGRLYSFYKAKVLAPDGRAYFVVVSFSVRRVEQGPIQGLAVVIILGSILGFMTLISVFMIRSINVSIARLEEAARRISDGDLDFTLQAKGSDRIASLTHPNLPSASVHPSSRSPSCRCRPSRAAPHGHA